MKKFKINLLLSIIVFLLMMPHSVLQAEASGNDIGVSMTASPSQSIVVKPVDSNAQARIDMKMTPFGKYDQLDRKPVDVVFIFDTSGSMNESGYRPQKFKSAKEAMYKALDYFKENAGPNDRFAFIPFSTEVDNQKVVGLTKQTDITFSLMKQRVSSINAEGGTNYRDPMELAHSMLKDSTNEKNIIFMTDGFLTTSTETIDYEEKCIKMNGNKCKDTAKDYSKPIKEPVHFNKNYLLNKDGYLYKIFGIYDENNNYLRGETDSQRLELIKYIKMKAKRTAQQIGGSQIKMYSIGFGNNRAELDQDYLEELSSVTGAYASPASEGNIDQIFLDIAESISKQKLDVEVTLDLAKFDGKVTVTEGANAALDGTKVTLRKSFEYEYLQNAPAPVDLTLPLEFNAVGMYTFDNIKLSYKRPDGSTADVEIPSVTIQVAAEAPPAINGSMVLKGESESNPVNNLIKQAGTRTNYFRTDYNLRPNGLSSNTIQGTLKNIRLIQPLPDPISLDERSASNVEIRTGANGGKEAVITLNQTVSYANGAFTPASFTASLKLKADWALHNVTMPQARVEYEDTRFKQLYSSSIPSASERITSKVRLDDGGNYYYDGYANGVIKKVEKSSGSTFAETTISNDYGLLPKPVKDMVFTDGDKAITITYSDDTSATLYFTADTGLTGVTSKKEITSGTTVYENVDAKLSRLVAGEDVQYFYRLDNGIWQPFGKDEIKTLKNIGLNTIDVKSSGGFSLSIEEIVSKEVTIAKQVDRIEIWSTGENPVKLEKLLVPEGESSDFEVKIFLKGEETPADAADQTWTYRVEDDTVADVNSVENNIGNMVGYKIGETTMTVTSDSDPTKDFPIPVIVETDFVELEGVSFKQAKYTNIEDKEVEDLIVITPFDATGAEITNVKAAKEEEGIVKITAPEENSDGKWRIESDKKGYTNVTVTVEQEKRDGTLIKKEATAVFETGDTTDGESAETIDGRW